MADETVRSSVHSSMHDFTVGRYVAGRHTGSVDHVYCFFVDHSGFTGLGYRKSTDGGATWGSDQTIHTTTKLGGFDIFCDNAVNGDSGTLIHIALFDVTGSSVSYYNLDMADDSLSAEMELATPTITSATTVTTNCITVGKSRGGQVHVQYIASTSASGHFKNSVAPFDTIGNWNSAADGADASTVDQMLLFPGGETDNKDMWMAYLDTSADELSVKVYDDSANSWSEDLLKTGMVVDSSKWRAMGGATRFSDDALLVACFQHPDNTGNPLRLFEYKASGITEVNTAVLDDSETVCPSVLIVNTSSGADKDDIYIAYIQGTLESTPKCYYKKSDDDGSTFGAQQTYGAEADDHKLVSSIMSINDDGGVFLPVFFDEDSNVLFSNSGNAVTISAPAAGTRRVFVVS